jgi:tRNA (mo5U34)-methyltransferase
LATRDERRRERLVAQVNRLKWVHRIDLGHGVVTPGLWGEAQPVIKRAYDEIDFRGKTFLDVGCWDGLWSFEAEKRGAAVVYATDLVSQRKFRGHPTVRLARRALGSRLRYEPNLSVSDVGRLGVRDFDVVLYAGVYYHLKDPLRSFSALRRVMKEGGLMIVEGAVLDGPGCFARYFYRDVHLWDRSNWWVPTVACLTQWVESSYFEVLRTYDLWDAGCGNLRGTLLARAVRRADPLYLRPDPELSAYDLNEYSPDDPDGSPARRSLPSRVLDVLRRGRTRV